MKKSKDTLHIPFQKTPHFELSPHVVTWKKDQNRLKKQFLPSDFEAFLVLYELSQKKPKKAKKDLELLKKRCDAVPELLNLLGFVYARCKKIKLADKLIIENFQKNPDNLLARINYADYCLRKKKLQKIPELFSETFDLTKLYPERKYFHISEFRGFMVMMGLYHLQIKKRETAICFHYLARAVDPHNPSTTCLGKKLYPTSFLKNFFNKNN
ncbi:MAG: hypothetical protein KAR79_05540 [Simkaniaceae bacterium]|nr:hypothetical protein [Simkaniaceae bacterium]